MSGELEYAVRTLVADVVHQELRKALDHLPELLREALGKGAAQPEDSYVTMRRAAEIAQVNPNSIRNWIRQGALTEFRAGRLVRVRVAELHRYLARPPATVAAVDIEEEVDRFLAKGQRWQEAKATAIAEANDRGEVLNHHQLRSRTHAVQKRLAERTAPKPRKRPAAR